MIIGAAHIQLGNYVEAVEWCRKASRHPTSSFWTFAYLAIALANLDRLDEARAALDDALHKQPNLSVATTSVMLERMYPEYKESLLDSLRKAGLPE